VWKRLDVGEEYSKALALLNEGLISCGELCGKFDLDGNGLWSFELGGEAAGVVVNKDFAFVLDKENKRLLVVDLDSGRAVRERKYLREPLAIASCGKYLAVATSNKLFLYDVGDRRRQRALSQARLELGTPSLAFSPDCKRLAVLGGGRLRLLDLNGEVLCEAPLPRASSVAWWRDELIIGFEDGRLAAYELEGYKPTVKVVKERSVDLPVLKFFPMEVKGKVFEAELKLVPEPLSGRWSCSKVGEGTKRSFTSAGGTRKP